MITQKKNKTHKKRAKHTKKMILMGEPLANCVTRHCVIIGIVSLESLDCRCELASEARTKTGNELLQKCVMIFFTKISF